MRRGSHECGYRKCSLTAILVRAQQPRVPNFDWTCVLVPFLTDMSGTETNQRFVLSRPANVTEVDREPTASYFSTRSLFCWKRQKSGPGYFFVLDGVRSYMCYIVPLFISALVVSSMFSMAYRYDKRESCSWFALRYATTSSL
jgi:hypothetical protein